MTEDQATTSISNGMHCLSPHMVCDGAAAAIDFYVAAFGATEIQRTPGPDGKLLHAAISVNGSSVMLVDENLEFGMFSPKALDGSPVTIHLIVDDADAWMKRAVAAGGVEAIAVQEVFWGDRYGVVVDPFGHAWALATPQPTLTDGP